MPALVKTPSVDGAPAELVSVPFRGGSLLAALVDGAPVVPLRPVCEALDLDWSSQLKKLRGKPWASVVFITTVAGDGKLREVACLDLRSLPMWLATVEPSRVRPEARGALLAYQTEAAAALARHFLAPPGSPPALAMGKREAAAVADEVLFLRAQTARLEVSLGLRPASTGALLEMRERLERVEARAGLSVATGDTAPGGAALALRGAAGPIVDLHHQVEVQRAALARLARVVGFDADGRIPDFTYVPRVDWQATGVARVRAWLMDCTVPLSDDEKRRTRGRNRGTPITALSQAFNAWCEGRGLSGLALSHFSRFLIMCGVQKWQTARGVRYALVLRSSVPALPAEVA